MEAKHAFKMVVGLEIHIQLNTKTKLFSNDSTIFGASPNSQTSPMSLAHPGTLPVLNEEVISLAIKMGLACNCDISKKVYFDRKHYFYPDSPLGYQITQQNNPICKGGYVYLPNEDKKIDIEKIHIEADAGRSIHDQDDEYSLIDLNRSGMPLLELVTKPVLNSIEDVGSFITEIQRIVRYTGVGDGNMEEGSLRCDANISIMRHSDKTLGKKVEIKNMNSIRHIKKALSFEFMRQSGQLRNGHTIVSESRLFHVGEGITMGMREKEEAHDYRYFPDPDISPYIVSEKELEEIREGMVPLPFQLRNNIIQHHGLSSENALIITDEKRFSDLYLAIIDNNIEPKVASKWLIGPIKGALNQIDSVKGSLNSIELGVLISAVEANKITYRNAVDIVLPEILKDSSLRTSEIISQYNLSVETDESSLENIIDQVLNNLPKEIEAYKKGKHTLLQLFMGQVMRETKGKADPKITMKLIKDKLG